MYFLSHDSKNVPPLELEGVTSAVQCIKCVPIPVIKQDNPPPWVAENWTTYPVPAGARKLTHPLSAAAHPLYFLTSFL